MADTFAHYVKFARSLAMTSTLALQACGGATDTADDPGATSSPSSATTSATTSTAPTTSTGEGGSGGSGGSGPAVADAGSPSDPDASDGSPGQLSGPLPPPELPRSFVLA
ncbi:MAG: hypothetical protein QM820_00695 [Minicystis sp.]